MRSVVGSNSDLKSLTRVTPSEPRQLRSEIAFAWNASEFPQPSRATAAEEETRRRRLPIYGRTMLLEISKVFDGVGSVPLQEIVRRRRLEKTLLISGVPDRFHRVRNC